MVATEFSDVLPPGWMTRSLRNRIARAEYEFAADPGGLISDRRIADAWNDYLGKIGAPQDSFVTPAELHTLRDSHFVSSKLIWARGIQNMWSMPNIYAVGPDGKVADGCRALEAIRILWDLANQPDNLSGARALLKKGVMLSDTISVPATLQNPDQQRFEMRIEGRVLTNPVAAAERQYLSDHGAAALNDAIKGVLDDLFPR